MSTTNEGGEPNDGLEQYVTLQRAAEVLALAPATLYERLSRGELPELRATKILGRWRIPVSAIQDVCERGRVYALGPGDRAKRPLPDIGQILREIKQQRRAQARGPVPRQHQRQRGQREGKSRTP